jgi:serine/threonine protein kinase
MEKNEIVHDINILNGRCNIQIKKSDYIGRGSYGKVYYIGNIAGINSVIKIVQSASRNNEYYNDYYFYLKYNSKGHKYKSLPQIVDYGKTVDNVKSNKGNIVDYIILEYVGAKNLFEIFKNRIIDSQERELFKMIFYCVYKHLVSFHDIGLIYRDVSAPNIVLSDKVTSFLMSKDPNICDNIDSKMRDLVYKKTSFDEIRNDFNCGKYYNLVKFVDGGFFGDLSHLSTVEEYKLDDDLFFGDYFDFREFDGLFSTTLHYGSPFYLFNLSSMIKKYDDAKVFNLSRQVIGNFLKLADIWSTCTIFAIHIHDIYVGGASYFSVMNKKNSEKKDIFDAIPFAIDEEGYITLNEQLTTAMNLNTLIIKEEYRPFRSCIFGILNKILNLVNILITKSKKDGNRYILDFEEENINFLYSKSHELLEEIDRDFTLEYVI